jgi:hypothetical protein
MIDSIFELADEIAKEIVKRTGADEKISYEAAQAVARAYAKKQRQETTNVRAAALAEADRRDRKK